uniref:Galactose specific C-type lectin n=1 Tax=Drosophila melanogaster TaxID=7227 RepID=Q94881_DROME|nr:galactose specific C-type lectin [Drosophila melanogaster]
MLKLTVLLITLLVIAKTGWTREKFSIQVNEGNTFGALVKAEPFTKINDGYYFFGTESLNWYEAYEKCRELNSELVTFETDQEFDAVTVSNGSRLTYWTSGNDLAKTGSHRWFTNGQRISSLRWARNQPDNAGQKEHCIHLGYIYKDSRKFELNDRPCSQDPNSLFKYICEAPEMETISIVVWK